ncbi:hypothetical protein ACFONL_09370 [Camelimonas fluminis]|uniref:Uncharacterized protein n=1 Tax=Camelimonas fluminis TaxID=1576911 RepID=A0ABV7UG71_9HYPH|nr:hypothetical protein [Camelimonas fluminis]
MNSQNITKYIRDIVLFLLKNRTKSHPVVSNRAQILKFVIDLNNMEGNPPHPNPHIAGRLSESNESDSLDSGQAQAEQKHFLQGNASYGFELCRSRSFATWSMTQVR